ncbi:polyprenyl synthetase family protein [Streptococcus parauberis]|uniref:polyprenyl synthetase family protein n=1 Tax=Streptococcus parauberis TaxID=1348 RepID=UPI0037B01B51
MSRYWNKFPEIQKEIDAVVELIGQRANVRNSNIKAAIVDLSTAGGKYLRPAFFFFFSQFGDQEQKNRDQLRQIAASLEILHMATLIHDDVIDDSPLRRGQKTIQTQFGKDVAVYTGDFLFTIFFELILESMQDSPYMTINAKAMKQILIGELEQMELYFNQEQDVESYLTAISGKTAELFQLASQEGAYFAGASQDVVSLAGRIGHHIGMTFQILDDILDYTADPKTFNKPVLEDLCNGVYSLPLLLAMKKNPAAFKPLLDKQRDMTSADRLQVKELVLTYGGVEEAKALANKYTEKALADIEQLPKIKAQKQLLEVTKELLKRDI